MKALVVKSVEVLNHAATVNSVNCNAAVDAVDHLPWLPDEAHLLALIDHQLDDSECLVAEAPVGGERHGSEVGLGLARQHIVGLVLLALSLLRQRLGPFRTH